MNATSHGLTGRLLVDDILNRYRAILGDAEAEEEELDSPRQKAAMNLAAAETRLALARQVHDEYLLGPDKDSPYEKGKAGSAK